MARTGKSCGALDRNIGMRIRTFRMQRNLSQTALASQLDVTFQQVQKYESGVNRVSASRLVAIARVLDVPILSFLPDENKAALHTPELTQASEFVASRDGARLCRAFLAVHEPRVRKKIIALVEELSGTAEAPPQPETARAAVPASSSS